MIEPLDAIAIRRTERLLVASELHARARRLKAAGHTLRADAVEKAANAIASSAKRSFFAPGQSAPGQFAGASSSASESVGVCPPAHVTDVGRGA